MLLGDSLRLSKVFKYSDEQLKEMTFICVDVSGIKPIQKLTGRDKLSAYFYVYEAASQDGCPVLLYNSETLKVLDQERKLGGPTTMTSGHRSIPWNTHENGATNSLHLFGEAYDHKNALGPVKQKDVLEELDGNYNNAIGIYNTFCHFDRGRSKRWDYR